MARIDKYKKELYELRFSPMCKPAGEVANLTNFEGHTTRARMIMLWRITEGFLEWGPREAELLYQSTLDSISEAFDVFHYPVSQIMLDARADVWDAGSAPQNIIDAIEYMNKIPNKESPELNQEKSFILGGELALIQENELPEMLGILQKTVSKTPVWVTPTGSVEYILGAREQAREKAETVVEGINKSGTKNIIADSPETAWMLQKVYPAFDLKLPEGLRFTLLSEALKGGSGLKKKHLGKVFLHDSRSAYLIADGTPSHLAILPGYLDNEDDFGNGTVYDTPRRLLDSMDCELLNGTWMRALAKSCGADDGLWLTYPDLARGLASQRLNYIVGLGTESLVCDSPLCASYIKKAAGDLDVPVYWLPELLAG
jgi:hypothetical protein